MDNDLYVHVNNVNYYSFFDTVIGQQYLIRVGNYPGASGGPGAFRLSCERPHPGWNWADGQLVG